MVQLLAVFAPAFSRPTFARALLLLCGTLLASGPPAGSAPGFDAPRARIAVQGAVYWMGRRATGHERYIAEWRARDPWPGGRRIDV